jgi:hypothetical protein
LLRGRAGRGLLLGAFPEEGVSLESNERSRETYFSAGEGGVAEGIVYFVCPGAFNAGENVLLWHVL